MKTEHYVYIGIGVAAGLAVGFFLGMNYCGKKNKG